MTTVESSPGDPSRDEGVDVTTVSRWLTAQVPDFAPPLRIELLSGGRSNLTYRMDDGGGNRYVLRRPPLGDVHATAHNVLREAHIIAALGRTDVPVPEVLGAHAERDLVGAPFFVMRFVEGQVLTGGHGSVGPVARQRVGEQMAQGLARIHSVDIDAVGLGDLRRPGTYVDRQLRRFMRQLDEPTLTAHPLLPRVHDQLIRGAPAQRETRIVHGDFKLSNVILADDGDVRAVLDWELTSAGDPLADLGWLVASWGDTSDGRWLVPPVTAVGGFATRDDLKQLYAATSGRDLADIDFYEAFAYWRWSCINMGTRKRFVSGLMASASIDIDALDAQVTWQLDRAAQLLNRG